MTDPFGQPQPGMQQFGQQPAYQQTQPAAAQPNFQAPPAPVQQPDQWGQQEATPPANTDTTGFFAGGGAAISFADRAWLGKPRGGQVIGKRMANQTTPDGTVKRWQDDTPRKQVIITLQTNERVSAEDDGKRDLYVKGYMVAAVREELQRLGVGDVEIGAWLYVAWVSEKPTNKGNPAKLFKAQYTRLGSPPPALASQPVQMPAPAVPQPGQDADQFAAYAAWQAQQAAAQQPAAAPQGAPMTQQQAAGVFGQQAPAQQPVPNPFG